MAAVAIQKEEPSLPRDIIAVPMTENEVALSADRREGFSVIDALPPELLLHVFRHFVAICNPLEAVKLMAAHFTLLCKAWRNLLSGKEGDSCLWAPLAHSLSPFFPDNLSSLLFCTFPSTWRSACIIHYIWSTTFLRLHQPIPIQVACQEISASSLAPVPPGCHRRFMVVVPSLCSYPEVGKSVLQRHADDIPHHERSVLTIDYKGGFSILSTTGETSLHCGALFGGLNSRTRCKPLYKNMHIRRVCRSDLATIFQTDESTEGEIIRGKEHANRNIEDQVFVVHNVFGNCCSNLWNINADEPCIAAYRRTLLFYYSYDGNARHIKCKEEGMNGRQIWCVDVSFPPLHMETNGCFVAIWRCGRTFSLLNILTGVTVKSTRLYRRDAMLLTDTFLVMKKRGCLSVLNLPDLMERYDLPVPNAPDFLSQWDYGFAEAALSCCGRYLGVSTSYGEMLLYDMMAGSSIYCRSNRDFQWRLRGRDDGIWIWYGDFRSGQTADYKLLHWRVCESFQKSHILLRRSAT